MAQTVQAYQATPASDDWRSKLKLPPKDTRFKTEVRARGRPCGAGWSAALALCSRFATIWAGC